MIILRDRAPASRPPAGRNPARLTVGPASGSATNDSPIGASVTRAPAEPLLVAAASGPTRRADTEATAPSAPNSSSTVMPSAWASASATRSDGSDWPDSTADTACRETPAMPASCCWE